MLAADTPILPARQDTSAGRAESVDYTYKTELFLDAVLLSAEKFGGFSINSYYSYYTLFYFDKELAHATT